MSCADVCIDQDYDGDIAEFYRESRPKARKPHQCCECGETIPVGTVYQRASGKSEGDVWSEATCAVCEEIRRAFVCGSVTFGMLWESIELEMFPIWTERGPIDCLAKLDTLAARDKCRARYQTWLNPVTGPAPDGSR